jgi:hypothetical protein
VFELTAENGEESQLTVSRIQSSEQQDAQLILEAILRSQHSTWHSKKYFIK